MTRRSAQEISRRGFFGASIVGVGGLLAACHGKAASSSGAAESEDFPWMSAMDSPSARRSAPGGPNKKAALAFTLGQMRPTAANTGHDPDLIDGTLQGDQLITTDGTLIENKRIEGTVFVNAANVTIRNCEIVGYAIAVTDVGYSGLVDTRSADCKNAAIEFCTFKPQTPSYLLNAVRGTNFTASRCDISDVVDGFHVTGGSFTAAGCYLHDFAFFDGSAGASDHADDKRFPGWSHSDGFEIFSLASGRIQGCNIQSYLNPKIGDAQTAIKGTAKGDNDGRSYPRLNYTNGVTVSTTRGHVTNLLITQNWFEGGEVAIQAPATSAGFGSGDSLTISGNRLGLDVKPGYRGNPTTGIQLIRIGVTGAISVSGNVFDAVPSVPPALRGQSIGDSVTHSGGLRVWEH